MKIKFWIFFSINISTGMCFWDYLLTKYPDGICGYSWVFTDFTKICFKCFKYYEHFFEESDDNLCYKVNNIDDWYYVLENKFAINGLVWNKNWVLGEMPWELLSDNLYLFIENDNDIQFLVRNKTIPPEVIEKICDKFLETAENISHYQYLISHLDWKIIEKHLDKINDHRTMSELCTNKSISWDFISLNSVGIHNIPWNISNLSRNKTIPLSFIESHIDGINGNPWDMKNLSANKAITWEFILKYSGILIWDISGLIKNPNVKSFDWINSYSNEINNNYIAIANLSLSVTLDFFLANYNKFNWSWCDILHNEELVAYYISINYNFSEIIKNNDYMDALSTNEMVPFTFIENNIEGFNGIPWDTLGLSDRSWDLENNKCRFKKSKLAVNPQETD